MSIMKKFFTIILLVLIVACSQEKEQGNMVVQGQIKGLKKGTLYLQKMKDTVIVSVDSIVLFGNDTFKLTDNISSSEMYYLNLDGKNISFFGEEGIITINDQVDKFGFSAEISGSKNQKIYEDYKKMISKFQGIQLDLLVANLQAQKDKDIKKSDSLRNESERQIRKKYIYTINFALNNPDSEAAAYIALTELVNSNVKFLDSINNTLTDRVKNTLYGKKLENFISEIKRTEN